ncbi:MAG: MerR family transcriptional regulator [Nocardiopsaceae bacterium]|jgi:DNA-binding transcriptional MerR regulator|nr:MerR family transcriptional regulator [Nocardiopsaceae bacterium]
MFSIGEFARHGRVSVRMLRHYDAVGLLRPAIVDPRSGYRSYRAGQLAQLNRIIALKDLGFTLQQVQAILDEQVSAAELRGMLRLRRAEIQAQIENETAKLSRVEARLLTIEEEGRVPADGIVIKHLTPMRVGELTGTAESYEPDAITPVIRPLYSDLFCRLFSAGVTTAGPAVAYYDDVPDGDGAVVVHASVPVVAETTGAQGFSVADLAEVEKAAAIIHQGSMDDVLSTGQALARWIDANGYQSVGYAREVTIEWSPDPDEWVTEVQQPIYATGG